MIPSAIHIPRLLERRELGLGRTFHSHYISSVNVLYMIVDPLSHLRAVQEVGGSARH